MKFALSYSGGKDSALALYKMINAGHTPVAMITTVRKSQSRSWFHGIDLPLLTEISRSLGIPLLMAESEGEDYHTAFEACLIQAAVMGAQSCAFGDIDIDGHLEWNRDRCQSAGLKCEMPLWKMSREQAVSEFISAGLLAAVKCIQNDKLDKSVLGKTLDWETVELFRRSGIDVCGENGEYHTIAYGGPIFEYTVGLNYGEVLDFGTHSAIDISLCK